MALLSIARVGIESPRSAPDKRRAFKIIPNTLFGLTEIEAFECII